MDSLETLEKPVSKVLILERASEHAAALKNQCDQHHLVGLRVREGSLITVLRSNIDLGAILLHEAYGNSLADTERIAHAIHSARPELPIILRRDHLSSADGLPAQLAADVAAIYTLDDPKGLSDVLEEYIFSMVYPNALVRGIIEITEGALASQFVTHTVHHDAPCIVRDRMIFGEVYSLIPIESSWCRGYMTLQTEEAPLLWLVNRTDAVDPGTTFRDVNSILGEVTNLIWGGFKNRFIGDSIPEASSVQVPLIVNHRHNYISFGTENPQLVFVYHLTNIETGETLKLYQRFVFNLGWSPALFQEITADASSLVESGELEMF